MQMNIRKNLYSYCGETYEDTIDHCSYAHNLSSCKMKIQLWTGFQTHDLYYTGAVFYQLSHQPKWELVTL